MIQRPVPIPVSEPRSDAPADVQALSEHVREVARRVGEAVRGHDGAADFPAPEAADPDHHLWRNGGQWWIAFTAHAGVAQERVRFSLGTAHRETARVRRDAVLRLFSQAEGLAISIRFTPRGRRRDAGPRARGARAARG